MRTPAERVALARAATATIDDALWPAIERLQRAGQVGNGAGIYADVSAFKRELALAMVVISEAARILRDTDWPTAEDYDASQRGTP